MSNVPPILVFLFAILCAGIACGEEFSYPHEDVESSWRVRPVPGSTLRVSGQRRQATIVHQGRFAEQLDVMCFRDGEYGQIEHPIPPARAIEDLRATLAFRSNRLGATVGFRAVLPRETDPRTGQPLTFLIKGETYQSQGQWQTLTVVASQKEIGRGLQLLRGKLHRPQLDTTGLFVDAVAVGFELRRGMSSFWLDDLQVKGVVTFDPKLAAPEADGLPGQVRLGSPMPESSRIAFQLHRLSIDGSPVFPRILPYHGESVPVLSQVGINTVWIPDYRNYSVSKQLSDEGLYVMATPPRPFGRDGESPAARQVSLAPFTNDSEPVMFWYVGTGIPAGSGTDLVSWRTQVMEADRTRNRPLAGDVAGGERFYSRYLSMISASQPVSGTSMSYRDYRDWLLTKRRTCRPGSFFWTWVDLENRAASRGGGGSGNAEGPLLEPEQIRLQTYAALSAGCRGLGFWTTRSLEGSDPRDVETRLTLAELNRELKLLEPILAQGTMISVIPLDFGQGERPKSKTTSRRRISGSTSDRLEPRKLVEPSERSAYEEGSQPRIEATLIRTDEAQLLLPVWYDPRANYVPGAMSAPSVTLIVPGVSESASAWLITPTGISNVPREPATGGIRIVLSKFNQTAAVLLTSDFNLVRRLQASVREMARESAMDSVLLAKAKHERVSRIEAELDSLGRRFPESREILDQSAQLLALGEQAVGRGDFRSARSSALDAMRLTRIVQRHRWEDAANTLPAPESSPYLRSYQELPRHWELISKIGRVSEYEIRSMLASGDFEDIRKMIEDGWQHAQAGGEGVRAAAELYPEKHPQSRGRYCLRMVAVPTDLENPPPLMEASSVTVSTPPVAIQAGDILHVSGWVRVRFPSEDRLDHALIHDTIQGPPSGIRLKRNQVWQRFEFVRVADRDDEFQVRFAIEGLGEMQIDDIRIAALETRTPGAGTNAPPGAESSTLQERARDLFNRLPGVGRSPGNETAPEVD
jgi:hypothetical protein